MPNTYTPEEAMISIERVLRREHDIGPEKRIISES